MEAREVFRGPRAELTQTVIGIFYAVANKLGHGFVESVYRRSLFIALRESGLRLEEEVKFPVHFHGQPVGVFQADLVVEGVLILELKVADDMSRDFERQLLNYLRCSGLELGLVLVFGPRALLKRVVLTNPQA